MGSRRSQILDHPNRKDIESGILKGTSIRAMARSYNVDPNAIRRYRDTEMADKLWQATNFNEALAEVKESFDVVEKIKELVKETEEIRKDAKKKGQKKLVLEAVEGSRRIFDLLAKLQMALYKATEHNRTQSKEAIVHDYKEQQSATWAAAVKSALSKDEQSTLTVLLAKVSIHMEGKDSGIGEEVQEVEEVDPDPSPSAGKFRRVKKT